MVLAISEVINALKSIIKDSSSYTRPSTEVATSALSYPNTQGVEVSAQPKEPISEEKRAKGGIDTRVLDEAVSKIMAYIREMIRGVIAGDSGTVAANAEYMRGYLMKLRSIYGDDAVIYVISKVRSIVGDRFFNLLVKGSVNDIMSVRPDVVTAYVTSVLKKKGANISPDTVRRVVARSKLDMRELARIIQEGISKITSMLHSSFSSGSLKQTIDEVRSAIAVGLGVSGEDFLKSLRRSFSGEARAVLDSLARSVTKPVSSNELIKTLSTTSSRGQIVHGKLSDVGKVNEVNTSSGESQESATVERMRRVFGAMKR